MSDLNRPSEPDKNDKRNGDMRLPPRTFLIWIGIIAAFCLLFLLRSGNEPQEEVLSNYRQLLDKLTNNLIVPDSGKITYGSQVPDIKRVTGRYFKIEKDGKKTEVPFRLD